MLPSKGLFSSIPCLFYSAGSCQRPHCHYRHCARDKSLCSKEDDGRIVAGSTGLTDDESSRSSLAGILTINARPNLLGSALDEPAWPGSEHSLGYVTKLVEKWVDRFGNQEKLNHLTREQKIEITIAKLQKNKIAALETGKSKSANLKTIVPSYEPTPIAELNKRHIPVVYAPEKPTIVRKVSEERSAVGLGFSKNTFDFDPLFNAEPSSSTSVLVPQKNSSNLIVENQFSFENSNRFDCPYDAKPSSPPSFLGNDSCSSREENLFSSERQETNALSNSVFSFGRIPEDQIVTNNKHLEFQSVSDEGKGNQKIQPLNQNDDNSEVAKCNRNGLSANTEIGRFDTKNSSTELVDSDIGITSKSNPIAAKKCDNPQRNEDEAVAFLRDLLSGNAEEDGVPELAVPDTVEDELAKLFCDDKVKEKSSVLVKTSKHPSENERERSNKEKPDCNKRKVKSGSSEPHRHRRHESGDKSSVEETSHPTNSSDSASKRLESSSRHHESSSKHSSSHHKHRSSSSKEKSKDKIKDRHSRESSHKSKSGSKTSSSSGKREKSKESRDNCHSAQAKRKAHDPVDVPLLDKRMKLNTETRDDTEADDTEDYFDAMDVDTADCAIVSPPMEAISIPSSESDDDVSETHPSTSNPNILEVQNEHLGTNQVRRWALAKEKLNKSIHGKVRIASVPNVNNLLLAKTQLLAKAKRPPVAVPAAPPTTTFRLADSADPIFDEPVAKVTKRVAHNKGGSKSYPVLIEDKNFKIPIPVRQRWCNQFYDNLVTFVDEDKARAMAAQEEYKIAQKCNLTKTYNNNCSLLILKIRKTEGQLSSGDPVKEKLSASSKPDYTYGWTLYECFEQYVMDGDELATHGYPFPLEDEPCRAYAVDNFAKKVHMTSDNKFVNMCENCSKTYEIDEDGIPTTSNDCHYHWGKLRKTKLWGQWTERFTCCQGDNEAPPCQSAVYHVRRGNVDELMSGFVATRPFPATLDDSLAGVVALDCEMCYTTKGLELGRLSVVDLNENLIFDEVVAMERPVLDYCTRFSGLDEAKMKKATYTFEDVRKWFLDHIYDKTIIVGHSLENDLKVLKIFHHKIVDTSVTFPHKFGFPYKQSLKNLSSSILQMHIQENESGHDSKEDAVACLKLMMHKLKEDSKVRKPRKVYSYSGKM